MKTACETCLFNPWTKALPQTAEVKGRQAHNTSLQKEPRAQKVKKKLGGTETIKLFLKLAKIQQSEALEGQLYT